VGPRWPDERVRHPVCAVLIAEDNNPYDAHAVAVWVQGLKVGHLSRANARRYHPGLLSLQRRYGQPVAQNGVIVGGGIREVARDGSAYSSATTPPISACEHPPANVNQCSPKVRPACWVSDRTAGRESSQSPVPARYPSGTARSQ